MSGPTGASLALRKGERRDPKKERYACSAKFFWRTFDGDAKVTRIPSPEDIERIEKRFPGTVIRNQVRRGMKLSELIEQDSYSYAICYLFIGGDDQKDLLDKYTRCMEMLPYELEPAP